jgi:Dynamin family
MAIKDFDEEEGLDSSSTSPFLGWETGWRLYEAYNELAAAAGRFEGKVEAPAVVVIGQQTDGKSALVEALMGFQFNHVGGGTKTRRPVELRLRYNPDCKEAPYCQLMSDSEPGVLTPMPLADIQVRFALPPSLGVDCSSVFLFFLFSLKSCARVIM